MPQQRQDPWAEIDQIVTGAARTPAPASDVWSEIDQVLKAPPKRTYASMADAMGTQREQPVTSDVLPTAVAGSGRVAAGEPYEEPSVIAARNAAALRPPTPVSSLASPFQQSLEALTHTASTPVAAPPAPRLGSAKTGGMATAPLPVPNALDLPGQALGTLLAAPSAAGERLFQQPLPGHEQEPDTFVGRLLSHAKMILSGDGAAVMPISPVGASMNPPDSVQTFTDAQLAQRAQVGLPTDRTKPRSRAQMIAEETARRGMDMVAKMAMDPTAIAAMGIGGAPGELLAAAFTADGVRTAARVATDPKSTPEDVATAILGVAIQAIPEAVRIARPPVEAAVRGFQRGYARGAAERSSIDVSTHQGFENAKPVSGPRAGDVAPDQGLARRQDVWDAVDAVVTTPSEPRSAEGPTTTLAETPTTPAAVRPGSGESVAPVAPSPDAPPSAPTVARTPTSAEVYRDYRRATIDAGQRPLMFHQWDDAGRPAGPQAAAPAPPPEFTPVGEEPQPAAQEPAQPEPSSPRVDPGSIIERINGKLASGEKLGTKEARDADAMRRGAEAAREAAAPPEETPAAPDHDETWRQVEEVAAATEPAAPAQADPRAKFLEAYTRHLTAAVTKNPRNYAYDVSEVPTVAGKMADALARGSANIDSGSLRKVAKDLSVTHTVGGWKAFLGGEVPAVEAPPAPASTPVTTKAGADKPPKIKNPRSLNEAYLAALKPFKGSDGKWYYVDTRQPNFHTVTALDKDGFPAPVRAFYPGSGFYHDDIPGVTFEGTYEDPEPRGDKHPSTPTKAEWDAGRSPEPLIPKPSTPVTPPPKQRPIVEFISGPNKGRKVAIEQQTERVVQGRFVNADGTDGGWISTDLRNVRPVSDAPAEPSTPVTPSEGPKEGLVRLTLKPEKGKRTNRSIEVPGETVGSFSVHQELNDEGTGVDPEGKWVVTHAPTGAFVASYANRDVAAWVANELQNAGGEAWNFTDPKAAKALDKALIQKALYLGNNGAILYQKAQRTAAKRKPKADTPVTQKAETTASGYVVGATYKQKHGPNKLVVIGEDERAIHVEGTDPHDGRKTKGMISKTRFASDYQRVAGVHQPKVSTPVTEAPKPDFAGAIDTKRVDELVKDGTLSVDKDGNLVVKAEPKASTPVTPKAEAPAKTPVTTPEEKYDAAARGKSYEDMTDAELRELLDVGVGDEPQKAAVELKRRQTPAQGEVGALATKLYAVFRDNPERIPKDPRELRRIAAAVTGKTEQQIADNIDELNDAVEAVLAQQIAPSVPTVPGDVSLTAALKDAQAIEAKLPRAHRSLEKTKLQQFSTPLPISVIAAHAAQINRTDVVVEPTAGTGNLLAAIVPRQDGGPQVFAMELAPRRVALLKAQGYHVTEGDYLATKPPQEPTVIVTNPPWGKYSTGKYGRGIALGFPPSDVAERFVAKNLRDLADGGRLVAVMPTTMLEAPNFKKWLRDNYTVRAIIKSPPGSYDTRATSVDSVLLVVDKVKGDGTLPKVVAAADWQAYISEVEAIHERSPIRAAEGRPAEVARPAPSGRPERVSGPSRTGGAEPRRDAAVGTGRPPDVVADEPASGGRGSVEFAGAADGPAPEPAGAPPVHVPAPSEHTKREAADSRFFAPYVRRSTIAGQPHPKLLVEAKQLSGVPYPKLTIKPTASMKRALDAGRVSVEQAEQALAVLQANSGDKPHGYLAADAVGVGKSREIAMSILGAMDRAKAEKRPLRLMLTTKSRDNVEDLLDEIHFVASGKPASQGGTVPFDVFRLSDDYPGAKKTGNAYEPLPTPDHAVYVVDSYNVAPFRQSLVDAKLHGLVGDEVQRFTNQDAQIGGAWQNLHARIMRDVARPEQFFAYFTATPAQKVEDYRYLYGLRLWPIDGFPEWLELVTGGLDEKKAKELEEATERGSVKSIDELIKQTAPDVVGADSEDGADKGKPKKSWQTHVSSVFAQRLTPAEGEQIPREWKILGRFSARDLWRKGTTFEIHNFDLTPAQSARYDQFVDLARDIMQTAYKYGLYDKSGKASRFGVSGALQFAAKRIQMQPALEEAVRVAKKLAAEGYQPVLSIINVSEMSDQGGHLTAAINKINTRLIDSDPNDPDAGLSDQGEIPEAVIDRARLMDRVRDLGSFGDPVDFIADELGKDKVAFIIGKEKSSRRKASGEFQTGKRTYAVISGAGSTGINLDQRTRTSTAPGHGRRVFLDVQYEWSAMEAVQRYGRVDRASSIAPPRIIALTSGNASEKKFLATIANRMAALGALSKGGAEATGAAGNALEEFEITGDDALAAARRAYEEADDDTKRSFAIVKSAFRNPNRNGSNPDHADFDPFLPSRDAHGVSMSDFQLPLLLMPMKQANAFWEKFIQYRDELRAESGERDAMRSARFSGDILDTHKLKENLDLVAVKNDKGQRFGILTGLITPEMPKLRDLLRGAKHEEAEEDHRVGYGATAAADISLKRRYVTFTGKGDQIVTGLQIPWTRIAHVADAYGRAVQGEKLDTPEKVLAYLKAGESIRLSVTNPDSGKPWTLRYRPSDARIAIDNARMQDRIQLLQHGADYVPVGNYWRVKDLGKFIERWPVPEQIGAKPKPPAASSGGGTTLQSAVIPGLKEFVDQDVTPGLKAAAEQVADAKSDLRALFAPDTVGRPAVTFAGTMRANLAAHSQRVQRAQKVLRSLEKAFDKVSNEKNLAFIDAIERGAIDSLPDDLRAAATQLRTLLDTKRRMVQQRGKLQEYIKDYFPHEWAEPGAVKKILNRILGRRPLQGSKNFLKKRKIPTTLEGIELGFEPVSYNPVTLVLHKLVEMDKWIMATDILRDAKRTGVAKFVRVGGDVPEGWTRYHESFGTVYGPPTVPVKEAYDKPLMDALFTWASDLGIKSVRKVAVGGNRWGYAVTPGDTVVTKVGGPEGVLMHEIGHILDERYGLRRQWVNDPAMRKELRDLADVRLEGGGGHSAYYRRYVRKGEEKIANLVHGFIYMPERTKKIAPRAYWKLYNLAKETPALKPILKLQKTRSTALGVNVSEVSVGGLVVKGHYYGPPEATRLLNNYLSPGLRGNAAYNAYRRVGNFMNQVQLGLSAFHLTMTGLEAVVSKLAQALQETERGVSLALRGEGKRSVVELMNAGKHVAETPVSTFLDLFRGHQALKAFYQQDANAKTIANLTDVIIQAGGGVGWDSLHHDSMPEALMRALRQGNYFGAAWRSVPAVFELTAKPIMEWWVPRLKIGAFLDLARMELRTLGEEPSIDEVRRVLAKTWDSIDNRFGELRYDNLFWHNVLKDMGMASVRALGWNVGTVREVFGAPGQQIGRLMKGTRDVRARHTGYEVDPLTGQQGERIFEREPEPWLTNKASYVVAMVVLYGVMGALYQLAHTGEWPDELRDYFFPKTGHRKPDGTYERVSLPGYFKDAYSVMHDLPGSAVTTAGHKLHPLLNAIYEMLTNEDYFGTEIRNADDPKVKQLQDEMRYFVNEQLRPMSLRNFERRRESLSGTGISGAESFFGISEAPASVSRSAAEKMIRDYTPEFHRTQDQAHAADLRRQIREGLRANTPEGRAAAKSAVASGELTSRQVQDAMHSVQTSPLQAGFKRLTLAQALNVYRVASERERAELWPLLQQKVGLLPNAAPNDQQDLVRRVRAAIALPRGAGRTPITTR